MLSFLVHLFPYKLDLKKKEPIELNISIKNLDKPPKSVIINISLDNTLSFDSKVLKSSFNQKINLLESDEEKYFRFKIYPSKGMHPGKSTHGGVVKVYEYSLGSEKLENVYEKPVKINVV